MCYARSREQLEAHLELLRCYYHFVRPHRAGKFGREVRTPAIQAGLTKRRLRFREIFSSPITLSAGKNVTSVFVHSVRWVNAGEAQLSVAA